MTEKLKKLVTHLVSVGYYPSVDSAEANDYYDTGDTECLFIRDCMVGMGPKLDMFDMPDDAPELVRSSYTDLGNIIVGSMDRKDLELLIDDLREIEYHAESDDSHHEYVKIYDKLFDVKDVGLLYTVMFMLDNDNCEYVSVDEIICNGKVYYGFELRNDLTFVMPAVFNEDIHELKLF